MRRILSGIICISILLSMCACSGKRSKLEKTDSVSSTAEELDSSIQVLDYSGSYSDQDTANNFVSVRDEELLTYMEDVVYYDLVEDLNSSDYYVEEVSTVYVSQEYIEEMTYNSQENIFFGYHLSDIKEAFGDKPWFFTVDENGQTVVTEYQYKEFEFEFFRMLRDITIGTGVILVCVTVSLVTAPALPAVSMIMMVAAKTATVFALSSGALGAISSGMITYIQTGNLEQSLQAAMDGGGQGYKIGAITGAFMGAAKEIMFLRQATATKYLTMNEAALIQRETKWPADVIAQIHNMEEYNVLAEANLKPYLIGGKTVLMPENIDWETPIDGMTNLQRIESGNAPIDPVNKQPYHLHHIGQEADATLAMIPQELHQSNHKILHSFTPENSVDHDTVWTKQKREFYKNLTAYVRKMLS